MFAGHVGVGLALGCAARRVNVGAFVVAALLLDVALWLFILAGWESVSIPSDFAVRHQADFAFPYSHGLLAAAAWSIAGGAVAWVLLTPSKWRSRVAALIAAAVFSHWLVDALVHRPELPLAGNASTKFGLGLWGAMPVAILAETALVALGLFLFLREGERSRGRAVAIAVVTVLILAFTVAGMTVAPPPPSALAMAASSLVTVVVVCALYVWLGRPGRSKGN